VIFRSIFLTPLESTQTYEALKSQRNQHDKYLNFSSLCVSESYFDFFFFLSHSLELRVNPSTDQNIP